MARQRLPCDETREDHKTRQRQIATWLVKTALVVGSRFKLALPADFYTHLFDERVPSDTTRIWLASTPYREHHQSDFRPIRVHPDDSPPPDESNAFCAMVVVGRLAAFIVSWLDEEPSTKRLLETFERAVVQVWPFSEPVTWPPTGGRLSFEWLDRLADSLVSIDEVQAGAGRPNE